jgi:hypothetical protein
MAQRRQIRELRLEIGFEAEALMAALGPEAYGAAQQRAQEASSVTMARDWGVVAAAIARRTKDRPPSILPAWLH